jgi:hypothetical protein
MHISVVFPAAVRRAYPGYQDVLGQRCVGVLDFDKRKLDATVGEFVYQVEQLTLCEMLAHVVCGVCLARCCCAALRDVPTPELGLTPCHSPIALHWRVLAGYTACKRHCRCTVSDPRTSGALHLQNALFSAILLECADKRGSDCEDSPLTVCWRAGLGTRGRGSIDDILVAPGDVGAVAGGVERGHGGGRV